MSDDLSNALQNLESEFTQFRDKGLGRIHEAYNRIETATPVDDLYGLLLHLEEQVKAARTGGIMGEGAGGHRRARDKWQEAGGKK